MYPPDIDAVKKASFDHTLMPPCQAACPLHMEIREYVDLIAQGRIMEALKVIRDGNPFPSICAYICPAPCETICRRGEVDNSIAIRALKRFAVEFGGDKMIQLEAETTHEERIAIVGSGPAALTAAYYLRKMGYPVTIFEAQPELGGVLRVAVPKYRLPQEVIDTEVQRLIQMGVEVRTDTPVVSPDLLFDMGYKAIYMGHKVIFVAVSAHQGLRLGIEGEESPGMVDVETFLREVNLSLKPSIAKKVEVALAIGRRAALCIDAYFQHKSLPVGKAEKETRTGSLLPKTVEMIKKLKRFEPPTVSTEAGIQEVEPVELVFDWESAVNEARRCLRCGMGAEILFQDKCATCLTCLRVCPYHVPYLDDSGTIQIPADQCQACGICVAECPARAIVLRKPQDRRQVAEELDHVLKSMAQAKLKPLIIGFCCQYGLYGTGALASLWREAKGGIWIVPVLCVAKIEAEHMLQAFEMGAEGVFIAGCGQEQCAREDTAFWALQRMSKARKLLAQIALEPERLQGFNLYPSDIDLAKALDEFTERIGELYLASAIRQEVRT
jgi:coenzyme F420-reducing hydrogenase delta subunit/Pyruvate/2-oxoacid:ferredoxin oxidoreductase delta subunit